MKRNKLFFMVLAVLSVFAFTFTLSGGTVAYAQPITCLDIPELDFFVARGIGQSDFSFQPDCGSSSVISNHWRTTVNNTTTTISSFHSHREHRAVGRINLIVVVRGPWRSAGQTSSVTHNHNANTIITTGIETR
ncbi:MAG: hypothetical protein FWG67_09785 [Defluviitaleaceae bacterium]|nr:hypothetical protein [Defluviitaleaceae bacterium]